MDYINLTPPEEDNSDPMREAQEIEAKKKRTLLLTIIASVAVLIIVIVTCFFLFTPSQSELETLRAEKAQSDSLLLAQQMELSELEFLKIDNEFQQVEGLNVTQPVDSALVNRYNAAKAEIEKLMQELKNEKNRSAEQINRLKAEIETLKGILRDYTQRINELMAENDSIKQVNSAVQSKNRQLNQQVEQMTRTNEQLTERVTLAEKLNVTDVTFTPLNKKGKKEKRITKATQLLVKFGLAENNTTPAGPKVINLRITTPEGDLLTGGGTFDFEGGTLEATARTTIEYANVAISDIAIYWPVSATLNPGDYIVELFCDNFRIASRTFTVKK